MIIKFTWKIYNYEKRIYLFESWNVTENKVKKGGKKSFFTEIIIYKMKKRIKQVHDTHTQNIYKNNQKI